ncbi:MAG: hypothetical protein ACJAYU_001505 [Bradymonadia bacterium]|jgi:hypothetical protein
MMLLALLGVAVPIAIHLINRQRAVKVRFPALEFLLKSNKKLARRLKIKQVMLLAMRISIFLLIPIAMSRPAMDCSGGGEQVDGRLPASVVIVIDDSASMSAPFEGSTRYDAALTQARDSVRGLRSWDQVAVVFAGSSAVYAVPSFTDDRSEVLGAIRDHQPRFGGGSLRTALADARDLQATSRLPARRTIVLTDRAAHSWPSGEELPVAGLGRLDWPDLGTTERNLAVSDLEATRGATSGEYELVATVRAYGGEDGESVAVTLLVDGTAVGTTVVDPLLGADAVAVFTHVFEGEGPFVVSAEVADLAGARADNTRSLPLQMRRAARALIVNGDARSVSLNDEAFYLERALSVATDGRQEFDTQVVVPDNLAEADLDALDVVILANVAGLPQAQVERLVAFVAAGGGVLLTAGENADPDRWNSAFAPLLPRPVRSVKVLANRGDSDAAIKATRFGSFQPLHPAFRLFALRGGESMQAGLVYSYLLLEPQADPETEVVASFADGGPALLERNIGRGRVMLLTTSIDYDWSDLPVATSYLPFVRRTVQYLGRSGAGGDQGAEVGSPLTLDVGSFRTQRVSVVDPAGSRRVLRVDAGVVTYTPDSLGIHRVFIDANGEEIAATSLDFSASAPAAEWPVGVIEEASLEEVTAASAEATGAELVGEVVGKPIWPAVLFLALVAIYGESLLAIRRRLWVRMSGRFRGREGAADL